MIFLKNSLATDFLSDFFLTFSIFLEKVIFFDFFLEIYHFFWKKHFFCILFTFFGNFRKKWKKVKKITFFSENGKMPFLFAYFWLFLKISKRSQKNHFFFWKIHWRPIFWVTFFWLFLFFWEKIFFSLKLKSWSLPIASSRIKSQVWNPTWKQPKTCCMSSRKN